MARLSRLAISGIAVVALAGCEVGPNFHSPAPPAVTSYTAQPTASETAGGQQQFVAGLDVSGDWWTSFQSSELNTLVEQALKFNPDLKAAQASLRAAQETYLAQRAALLPTVGVSYNLTREKTSGTIAPLLTSNSDLFTLHTAQLNVAYTADVFGGIRRETESVKAQTDAQRYQTEAAYVTLTANLVAAAIQKAMLSEQVDATKAIIKSDQDVLAIMRRQFELGEIARADVAAQEALVAQAQQTLPPLEKQRAQQQDLIADLTGQFPSAQMADVRLAGLTLPRDLPLSLPSKLVDQRPDIRAASANLQSASAQVGVAMANRLPSFTIAANAGGAATNIPQLFAGSNGFWMAAANVAQPIFDGGALKHRQRGAEALLDQAKDQYQSTVLSAFQNVADTLQALQSDAQGLQYAAAGEQSTRQSLEIAQRQFEAGQVNSITVLNAEQTYQQSVLGLAQARANRFSDTVALFQSLGGGWWNRAETVSG